MIEIRAVTAADAEVVADLWLMAGLVSSTTGRTAEIVRKLDRDPELFLLAEHPSDGAVGTVMGAYDGHRGYVKRMAVKPTHRRARIAKRLMDELELRFVALGVPRVHLHVLEQNDSGRGLWHSLGYSNEPEVLFYGKDLAAVPADEGRC